MARLLNRYAVNAKGRDYVVGDIHGRFTALEDLLGYIGFDTDCDRLFSVGDLIDRGPESQRVTEFLELPWFHAILGNHEVMLLESAYAVTELPAARNNAQLWRINGGGWFLEQAFATQRAIYTAIDQLPLAAEIGLANDQCAGLVHAGIGADTTNERHWSRLKAAPDALFHAGEFDQVTDLVWDRELAYAVIRNGPPGSQVDVTIHGIDVVFLGHTPMEMPIRVNNTRWLDTGAGHGEQLSLAELAVEGMVWSMALSDRTLSHGWHTPATGA